MLNLWLVCPVGVDNRKVKMAFLLFVYLSFHRLCLSSQIGLDTVAGFRSFRKEVSLITCHAKKTTWKHRNPSGSDECCAPASNSGKRRESASTWLLSASFPFVLTRSCFCTCSCLGGMLIPTTATAVLWQWVLKVCNPPCVGFHFLTL